MLQLRPECAELLEKLDKKSNNTVTCVFGDHIQFEQLDKTKLLPRDLMCIVHDYFDDKMIVDCSVYLDHLGSPTIKFNINNTSVYEYDTYYKSLYVNNENLKQIDDSISINYHYANVFNLSMFYQYYCKYNNLFLFDDMYGYCTLTINNNEYTIIHTKFDILYKVTICNHEILQRRIIVMKQLIDIIEKN